MCPVSALLRALRSDGVLSRSLPSDPNALAGASRHSDRLN